MAHQISCAAFHREKDLAVVTLNGVLNVWDAESGSKKNEFTPAGHLTSSFTCLSWKIYKSIATKKHNRIAAKRKSKAADVGDEQTIAVGTATGEIYLYNIRMGEMIGKLQGEHTTRVNGVCWNPYDQSLLSCSDDQHIVHWDVSSYKAICKWKGDKSGVNSICVASPSAVLTAGKKIQLWDLKTQVLLRKFSGHASPVISLVCVERGFIGRRKEDDTLAEANGMFFLSAAADDRIVNVWKVSAKHINMAVASFSLEAEPVTMLVKPPAAKDKPLFLMVLTAEGDVNIFSHVINGQTKKPLEVQMVLTLKDPAGKKLQILSASFVENCESETATLLIAYGTNMKIVFEKVNLDNHVTERVVLVRKDPMKIEVDSEQGSLKRKQPIRNRAEITTLVPGLPAHGEKLAVREVATKDRSKRKKIGEIPLSETEMTMEERVNALTVRPDDDAEEPPTLKTDSLSVLLAQGLQSDDKHVLSVVLQNKNMLLIQNTVRNLPVSLVVPLVQDLAGRLQQTPDATSKFVLWLRETLKYHASYLMTLPDLVPLLSHVYQLLSARTKVHKKLVKLEAKLELMAIQINTKTDSYPEPVKMPMLVYEDDSADEDDDVLLDDLPEADSDLSDANEWDEPGEMDIEGPGKIEEASDDDETDSGVANGAMEED